MRSEVLSIVATQVLKTNLSAEFVCDAQVDDRGRDFKLRLKVSANGKKYLRTSAHLFEKGEDEMSYVICAVLDQMKHLPSFKRGIEQADENARTANHLSGEREFKSPLGKRAVVA